MAPQLIHFAPVDLALEAIHRGDDDASESAGLDTGFRLDQKVPPPIEGPDGEPRQPQDDASWVDARLSELPPVASDLYYSLTGRYETLKLILELLAVKHASEGREPTTYGLSDYVEALVEEAKTP